MTDQPQGPSEPPRDDQAAAPPPPSSSPPAAGPGAPAEPPPAPPVAPAVAPPAAPPSTAPAYAPPPQQPGYAAPPPQPGPAAPPPQQAGYAAPPPGYGQQAYGQPGPGQPAYGQAPPQPNPYGGYAQAPVYAGGRPTHPGSIGYVEQNFGPVADFGQRALALIIDIAITLVGLIPMIIGFVLITAGASTTYSTYDEFGNTTLAGGNRGLIATGVALVVIGSLVSFGIWLWNRVFRMGRTGQSVGKKSIGLKLVDDKTGQPIGAGMSFLREIVAGIVNQIFYLSYLWMLWDADKQTVADKAVHSTVIVLPKA